MSKNRFVVMLFAIAAAIGSVLGTLVQNPDAFSASFTITVPFGVALMAFFLVIFVLLTVVLNFIEKKNTDQLPIGI